MTDFPLIKEKVFSENSKENVIVITTFALSCHRSLSCTTSTPNIPNEILSMAPPLDNSDWVIRFGTGHHTTDTALACSSTLDTLDYYWEVSSYNISYNTCHMISPILGGRLPARAAIWLSGNSNLNSITMFYETSLKPVCSAGQNTWCNVPSKAGWYCLSNMYLVNSFSVSGV